MKKNIMKLVMTFAVAGILFVSKDTTAKAAMGQNEYGLYYIDDATGQYVTNNFVESNGNTYFISSNGYALCGTWFCSPDGNWYFANFDGTVAKSCTLEIKGSTGYYDIGSGEFVFNPVADGVYSFTATGANAETESGNTTNTTTSNTEDVYTFSDEEIYAYASQYLPAYVTYAQPLYYWNWGIGYDVRFTTDCGLYQVYLERDIVSSVLTGSGLNSLYCSKAGFIQ